MIDKRERRDNNYNEEKKILNPISTFLYSFALVFFEVLLIDLLISQENILDYKMNFTLGLILTLAVISIITVGYMSKKFSSFVKVIKGSKLNIIALIVGVVALVYLLNVFLDFKIFSLSILPIIIFEVAILIIARVIEKK